MTATDSPTPRGATLWFTGLPSAGKTTIARALADRLRADGHQVELLDGDIVRPHLSQGLGYSKEDRDINVARIGYVARLLARNGVLALAPVVAPYRAARESVRAGHAEDGTLYLEVFVSTPADICQDRDVKGLYAKAAAGEITGMTGFDDPYEAPLSPDVVLPTQELPLADSVELLYDALRERGFAVTTEVTAPGLDGTTRSQLDALENESIHIFREVAAEFERPAMLFSGGKDSIVMLHLAVKAFSPAKVPFPLMHVDTGHNFPEVIDYRDRRVAELGVDLVIASVQEAIDSGRIREIPGQSRNQLQTIPLLDGIEKGKYDAVFGGGRRDEEKARAKERVFSLRDEFGQWDPRNQRPELWDLYNGKHRTGEHFRVFPISNWTEMDVWAYVRRERIEVPSIYFAHQREVYLRDGMWLWKSAEFPPKAGETAVTKTVRFRTVGDISCTGAVVSDAATLDAIVAETAASTLTERGATRADDRASEAAMEDRKREGYF